MTLLQKKNGKSQTLRRIALFQKKIIIKKPKQSNTSAKRLKVVGLIMEMSLKTEFWKLKTPKMCFQFL